MLYVYWSAGKMKRMNNKFKLFISILVPLIIGAIAGYATATNVGNWYSHLNKPTFNPPNAVFAPVWTILYISMGIACYLVWKAPVSQKRNLAIFFYFAQLFFNFCWSFIFFYYHRIGFAIIDIVLLWVMIFITIVLFSNYSKTASWLMVPYISWVSFATILNLAIYHLN